MLGDEGADRRIDDLRLRFAETARIKVVSAVPDIAESSVVEAAEERLVRDRRDDLRLGLHRQPLLRLDRLVQPVAPPAAVHDAPGELVDDERLAVAHDVRLVLDEELASP